MFKTPILFLVYNRPDLTIKVLETIRAIKPMYFYIGADGPRKEISDDNEKCDSVRSLILEIIDWECEVKILFRDVNLGCGLAVSQAISWFFEHVEEGIILEDDCLVDLTFFSFAQEMLKKYRKEKKVFHIAANSIIGTTIRHDYDFSIYPLIWGWASWRRAWEKYNFNIEKCIIEEVVNSSFKDVSRKNYWKTHFALVQSGQIDTWDYQWLFTCLRNNGLSIIPKRNLVTNIGFDDRATHTHEANSLRSNQKAFQIENWYNYPSKPVANKRLDINIESEIFSLPIPLNLFDKVKLKFLNAYSTHFNI